MTRQEQVDDLASSLTGAIECIESPLSYGETPLFYTLNDNGLPTLNMGSLAAKSFTDLVRLRRFMSGEFGEELRLEPQEIGDSFGALMNDLEAQPPNSTVWCLSTYECLTEVFLAAFHSLTSTAKGEPLALDCSLFLERRVDNKAMLNPEAAAAFLFAGYLQDINILQSRTMVTLQRNTLKYAVTCIAVLSARKIILERSDGSVNSIFETAMGYVKAQA